MLYRSEETERNAAMRTAELMTAAARTAPKACAVDAIETLVLDGEDKNRLTAAMRELGADGKSFFIRDAGNVDSCHCIVLVGVGVGPRSLDCSLCSAESCGDAVKKGIPCALAVTDLGIAIGSAAATAMDMRADNRILFSAGMAALKLRLFSDRVRVCYGIGLSTTGKNVFFDRPAIQQL